MPNKTDADLITEMLKRKAHEYGITPDIQDKMAFEMQLRAIGQTLVQHPDLEPFEWAFPTIDVNKPINIRKWSTNITITEADYQRSIHLSWWTRLKLKIYNFFH